MFLAIALAYRYHQEQSGSAETEDNSDNSSIAKVHDIIKTRSSQLIHHARRCYEPTNECLKETDESFSTMSDDDPVVGAQDLDPVDVFRDDIRQEWIDAVFGTDFFSTPDYEPKKQGVGLSNIASYVTTQATIPENVKEKGERAGATLSRIALGLYVRRVEPGSEASYAGVREGSILVDVNGMGLLGEPSKHALERLWQYEGHQEADEDVLAKSHSKNGSEKHNPFRERPVAMKFIKNGELYAVVFLANPPFGIVWAPCGNFALVQRSHSFAVEAGVRRGSLVAAVNDKSIRTLDHESAAAEIKEAFTDGKAIRLTLAYTPAASRPVFFDRLMNENKGGKSQSPKPKKKIAELDGVEVRYHPLEYGIASLFMSSKEHETKKVDGHLSELAARVAAGELEAPSGMNRSISNVSAIAATTSKPKHQGKIYQRCPTLPKDQMICNWDPLDSLLFLSQACASGFDDQAMNEKMLVSSERLSIEVLKEFAQSDDFWKTVNALLLQWVSMLCSFEDEEGSVEKANHTKEIATLLLSMTRRSDDLCQRLYFLLRAFTATFESQKKQTKKEGSARARLMLLQGLERLRTAQKDLASQLSRDKQVGEVSRSNLGESGLSIDVFDVDSPDIGALLKESQSFPPPTPRKKSVFKLFKKKKSKSNPKTPSHTKKPGMRPDSPMPIFPVEPTPNSPLTQLSLQLDYLSISTLLDNMSSFLLELDGVCDQIEGSLLKSFSQRIADWALQPWSASKKTVLAKVTSSMRQSLKEVLLADDAPLPIVNPIESSEVLTSLKADRCYILPSAHFPILLTFTSEPKQPNSHSTASSFLRNDQEFYSMVVEVVGLRSSLSPAKVTQPSVEQTDTEVSVYMVEGAVSGMVKESGKSRQVDETSNSHRWAQDSTMVFDTKSSWGPPQTLSLRVSSLGRDGNEKTSHSDDNGTLQSVSEVGSCWVDLKPMWDKLEANNSESSVTNCHGQIWSLDPTESFNEHGDIVDGPAVVPERFELELKIHVSKKAPGALGAPQQEKMMLYKHDDDLRQEMFAIQFFDVCDALLKSSGLDLKILSFRCTPVGSRRGFIEWVPGSVPLSDICLPFAGSILAPKDDQHTEAHQESDKDENQEDEMKKSSTLSKAGLSKFRTLRPTTRCASKDRSGMCNNPVQDFLRSVAYDPIDPYFIRREVMDTYVKSCAGYCVLTYLLGVGDRHLDNLLLHQTGHFFHCDFTFMFGRDPKKYLPVRITEDMILGMGGLESDNYAKFISLVGAAFIALRRHENVRIILSMVRLMAPAALPDLSVFQAVEDVILSVRDRLRLDLSDDDAVSYIEELIKNSISSKMWIAVDAIHSLGKRF